MSALVVLMESFFRRLRIAVLNADEQGYGREITGPVPGREASEDVEVEIDVRALLLFHEILEGLRVTYPDLDGIRVYTEHHPEGEGSDNPKIRCYLDPFDGSDEYLKGLESSWYSAVTFVDANFKPLAAGMLDILAGKMYFATREGVWVLFLRTETRRSVTPDRTLKIPFEGGALAAYMGKAKYLLPLVRMLGSLLPDPDTKAKHFKQLSWHGKGGSFVYAWIAAGKLLGYVMPNEPVSEILPGWGFAAFAGFPIFVLQDDGQWVEFNPAVHGEMDRVPALVAGCTQGLAQDVIRRLVPQARSKE